MYMCIILYDIYVCGKCCIIISIWFSHFLSLSLSLIPPSLPPSLSPSPSLPPPLLHLQIHSLSTRPVQWQCPLCSTSLQETVFVWWSGGWGKWYSQRLWPLVMMPCVQVNLCFDQLVYKLSEQIFQYYKHLAARYHIVHTTYPQWHCTCTDTMCNTCTVPVKPSS